MHWMQQQQQSDDITQDVYRMSKWGDLPFSSQEDSKESSSLQKVSFHTKEKRSLETEVELNWSTQTLFYFSVKNVHHGTARRTGTWLSCSDFTIEATMWFYMLMFGQNFYRQTTVEFFKYELRWIKTWWMWIFLGCQNLYKGSRVWMLKCGTVWENMVSVDLNMVYVDITTETTSLVRIFMVT